MAEAPEKSDDAEKAYAAAASVAKTAAPADKAPPPATKPVVTAKQAKPKQKAIAKKAIAKKVAKPATKAPQAKIEKPVSAKPVSPKPEPVKPAVPEIVAAEPKPAPKPVRAQEPVITAKPVMIESKEPVMETMETVTTPDYSSMLSEMQLKAKEAYEKGTASVSEATEFAKGNVEALVESGKIFAGGMQDMGKTVVDEAKSAYETMTADMKEMAAVKSPTELFQLQGKIMRRNFDALVATSSKNTEAMMKLANDSFAPLSGRMNMAAEKMSKVA